MQDLNCWESKFTACYYSNRLINKITWLNKHKQHQETVDLKEIKKAIYYAKKYHGIQKRQTGEPFYSHPLEVAYLISDYLCTTEILIVSILHDTIEDTQLTSKMISVIFNPNIANKVYDLTRIKLNRKFTSGEIIEQLFIANKKDLLAIKVFDRLHNLYTINVKSIEKIKYTVLETLKSFLAAAVYCELQTIENMLSDLCFSIQLSFGWIEEQCYCFSYDSFQLPYLDYQSNILQRCIQPKSAL